MTGRHIVFATTGSLGDLHPFLALGCEMQRRGHRVTIATSVVHRAEVGRAGLAFHHMRPDPEDTPAFHARFMHPTTGGEFVYRDYLAPAIRASYADLLQATKGADLLVSQTLMALAAPLVASRTGIMWVSVVLQPMAFFSLHERPNYLPRGVSWLCGRSPAFHAKVMYYVKKHTRGWLLPVLGLRQELGILHQQHPLYEGQHSPTCVLAMFSSLMGTTQPDWPEVTLQTGTALHVTDAVLPALLREFIDRSPVPLVVFTLSSASSNDAGNFYAESLKAAAALGVRALLVMGGLAKQSALPTPLPAWAFRIDYVAFELVFCHASAVVHSGGSATSFKALMAGKPQLIVPHAHDQRDNALRLQRLGVAGVIQQRRPKWQTIRSALASVLNNVEMQEKAAAVSQKAHVERGVGNGCDAIEAVMTNA